MDGITFMEIGGYMFIGGMIILLSLAYYYLIIENLIETFQDRNWGWFTVFISINIIILGLILMAIGDFIIEAQGVML